MRSKTLKFTMYIIVGFIITPRYICMHVYNFVRDINYNL